MSSPSKETEQVSSSDAVSNGARGAVEASAEPPRPPAKRPAPAVIEISDTESDDSDICAVTSYQATADEVKRIRGGEWRIAVFAWRVCAGNLTPYTKVLLRS